MKIKKTGRVIIESNEIRIEGFTFEGEGDPENFPSKEMAQETASILALDWAAEKIAEARLKSSEFSAENNKWEP